MPERKPINFITSTDYNSSTSPGYSTVTLTSDTYDLHYDGVNIQKEKQSVGVGDVLTTNGEWYDGETIDSSIIPNVVGVVINRKGKKVLLHSVKSLSYSSNQYTTTSNVLSTCPFYNSSVYYTDNVANSYNISKFPNIDVNFPAKIGLLRKNGEYVSFRAGMSKEKLLYYFATIEHSGLNNNSIFDYKSSGFIINEYDWDAGVYSGSSTITEEQRTTFNQYITEQKALFSTWKDYIKNIMVDYPKLSGIMSICIGKAHEWTKNLAKYKVNGKDENNYPLATLDEEPTIINDASFPPAYWANNLSETATGYNLGAGQWYLIGADELFEWFSNYNKLEKTAKVFKKLGCLDSIYGGSNNDNLVKLLSSNRLCCARYNSSNVWLYSIIGSFNGSYFFYHNFPVSAVCSFDL